MYHRHTYSGQVFEEQKKRYFESGAESIAVTKDKIN